MNLCMLDIYNNVRLELLNSGFKNINKRLFQQTFLIIIFLGINI